MNKYTSDYKDKEIATLFFSGPYCGQCRLVKPRVEKDAESHPELNLCEVSTGEEAGMDLAAEYGVTQLPTVVVLKKGIMHAKLVGAGQVSVKKILASTD